MHERAAAQETECDVLLETLELRAHQEETLNAELSVIRAKLNSPSSITAPVAGVTTSMLQVERADMVNSKEAKKLQHCPQQCHLRRTAATPATFEGFGCVVIAFGSWVLLCRHLCTEATGPSRITEESTPCDYQFFRLHRHIQNCKSHMVVALIGDAARRIVCVVYRAWVKRWRDMTIETERALTSTSKTEAFTLQLNRRMLADRTITLLARSIGCIFASLAFKCWIHWVSGLYITIVFGHWAQICRNHCPQAKCLRQPPVLAARNSEMEVLQRLAETMRVEENWLATELCLERQEFGRLSWQEQNSKIFEEAGSCINGLEAERTREFHYHPYIEHDALVEDLQQQLLQRHSDLTIQGLELHTLEMRNEELLFENTLHKGDMGLLFTVEHVEHHAMHREVNAWSHKVKDLCSQLSQLQSELDVSEHRMHSVHGWENEVHYAASCESLKSMELQYSRFEKDQTEVEVFARGKIISALQCEIQNARHERDELMEIVSRCKYAEHEADAQERRQPTTRVDLLHLREVQQWQLERGRHTSLQSAETKCATHRWHEGPVPSSRVGNQCDSPFMSSGNASFSASGSHMRGGRQKFTMRCGNHNPLTYSDVSSKGNFGLSDAEESTRLPAALLCTSSPARPIAMPDMLRISAPCLRLCAGVYKRILGELANGMPVYKQYRGDHFLFSGTNGRWFVGGHEEKRIGFACNAGVLVSRDVHSGSSPDEVVSWQWFDGARWINDIDIHIAAMPYRTRIVEVVARMGSLSPPCKPVVAISAFGHGVSGVAARAPGSW